MAREGAEDDANASRREASDDDAVLSAIFDPTFAAAGGWPMPPAVCMGGSSAADGVEGGPMEGPGRRVHAAAADGVQQPSPAQWTLEPTPEPAPPTTTASCRCPTTQGASLADAADAADSVAASTTAAAVTAMPTTGTVASDAMTGPTMTTTIDADVGQLERRAIALADDGHLDEALAALLRAREMAPTSASVHNNLAQVHRLRGDTEVRDEQMMRLSRLAVRLFRWLAAATDEE